MIVRERESGPSDSVRRAALGESRYYALLVAFLSPGLVGRSCREAREGEGIYFFLNNNPSATMVFRQKKT